MRFLCEIVYSMERMIAVRKTSINMRMVTNCSRMGPRTSKAIINPIRTKNRSFECDSDFNELNDRGISIYPFV